MPPADASCNARLMCPDCDQRWIGHDEGCPNRVVARRGERGTVITAYDDGSFLVKLDAPPQNRRRYASMDLRLESEVDAERSDA